MRSPRILLIENDPDLRNLVRTALTQAGYLVLGASTALEAFRLIGRNPDTIDLALCDFVIPGTSGSELAELIEKLRPGTKIILMCKRVADTAALTQKWRVIRKPFLMPALLNEVAASLHE